MLLDFETEKIPAQWDVCIVGAGPAGITLALKLAEKGMTVGLLEAGALEYAERSQSLYQVESTGTDLWAASTRLRYFGGTSNHWAGRCRPFERDDFEYPPQGGLSGWPISFDEMDRHRPEAMRILDLPPGGFASINKALPGGHFDADKFSTSPPTRFAKKYLEALRSSRQIHLIINCNVINIAFDGQTSQVSGLHLADYKGKNAKIHSTFFILAAGAIENTRLLLNSQDLMAAGVGGQMIGKGFMEHLNVELGTFVFSENVKPGQLQYYANRNLAQRQHTGKGNILLDLQDEIKSFGRTAAIKTFLKHLACKMGVNEKFQLISQFNCPGAGVIGTLLEQFPEINGSRISLLEERDAIGLRKARVHWVLSDNDQVTVRKIGIQMAKDFAAAGLGFIRLSDFVTNNAIPIKFGPHAHHMGGTRMSADVEGGVVDENLKVFRTQNLFVAGSSVFATGGGGNPTMPIIQLTLRLAEHLHKLMPDQQSGHRLP